MQLIANNLIPYEEYRIMRDSLQEESFDCEYWVPVIGLEKYYEVSNLCRFRAKLDIINTRGSRYGKKGTLRYQKGQVIQQKLAPQNPYFYITLYDPEFESGQSSKSIYNGAYCHRLCSMSFARQIDNLITDHIDGNMHNNQITNLQRLTPTEHNRKTYANNDGNIRGKHCSKILRSDSVVFDDLKSAAESVGASPELIIGAIRSGNNYRGYTWKYADLQRQRVIDACIEKRNYRYKYCKCTNTGYELICIETGEILKSTDMARKYNTSSESLFNAIDYNEGYHKATGLHFKFTDPRLN